MKYNSAFAEPRLCKITVLQLYFFSTGFFDIVHNRHSQLHDR